MATSVNLGYPIWLDGETFNGLIGRSFDVAALTYQIGTSSATAVLGGVLPSGGASALQVAAGSGMNITIAPGFCVVPNTTSSLYGGYRMGSTQQQTLTVAASDPTNPRIDLVCAQVTDTGTSSSFCQLELVAGTPAPSPSAPAAPSNSITLAQISVAAGASVINAGNITDQRTWTVPPGGILPVTSAGAAPVGQNGAYVHDLTVGRLAHNGASGVKQTHLLPFAPVVVQATSNITTTGAETTILSATFTADGSTDVEVIYKWSDIYDPVSNLSNCYCNLNIYLDSSKIDIFVTAPITNAPPGGGGCSMIRTSAALSTTPAAGSHTVTWKMQPLNNSGHAITLNAGTGYPAQLIVQPVCL